MNLIQEGIYKICEEDPKGVFWYLTKYNFANAKLFWGGEYRTTEDGHYIISPQYPFEWQYHLQVMILSDNPLDYMKKSIEKENDKKKNS